MLRDKENRIIDIAMEYGFASHVTFTRAFKETYGITPSQYRDKPIGLQNFVKPDLSLGYVVADEGIPLISDGLVYLITATRQTIIPVILLVQKSKRTRKCRVLQVGSCLYGNMWCVDLNRKIMNR